MSEPLQLKVGRVYRGKKPRGVGFPPLYDDRVILWICPLGNHVQYNSPTVLRGRKFPKIEKDKFIKWAGRDVTDELPKGEWQEVLL